MSTWLTRSGVILACVASALSVPAAALDYQLHGFAAQGLINSEGNDYYGDSTRTSLDYYEAGLNGSANLGYGLLLAAQGIVRDAGATDDGDFRLDYALLDYGYALASTATVGLRAGRVKNAFGFYNDARDVIFTRPGILLPMMYSDAQGIRSLLFSSDGAEVYARAFYGSHELSLSGSYATDRDLNRVETRQFATNRAFDHTDTRVDELRFARLQDEWAGGRFKLAFSYVGGDLEVDDPRAAPSMSDPRPLFDGVLEIEMYVLSAAYQDEHFSLIGEYAQTHTHSRFLSFPGRNGTVVGDGLYVQADWRVTPNGKLYLRRDMVFTDREDRNGREAAERFAIDRYSRFTYDTVLGMNYNWGRNWGLWAEGHLIDGTSTVSTVDNLGQVRDHHWSLLAVMLAYRF